jgi:hypothetical protein
MKTAKELAAGFYYGSDALAKRVSSCRRLATGISSSSDSLSLTPSELETLNKASNLLREMATVYGKAAKLRKAAEAARADWVKAARALMKDTFETLTTTADKVALIGLEKSHMLDVAALRGDRGRWQAQYLLKETFGNCLNDVACGLSPRFDGVAPGPKDLTPAAAVAAAWQRFLERREQLQEKYAMVIVLVDRALSPERVS